MGSVMRGTGTLVALLLAAVPCAADIIPSSPDAAPVNQDAARAVRQQIVRLGVPVADADRILASLTPAELEYFRLKPAAGAVVGQEEIVVMFWYEWVFALAYGYAAWKFWDTWGCEAFFPAQSCD